MGAIYDLHSFLEVLEEAGQLARIDVPVSLKYELADVTMQLERQNGPAPLFTRVEGHTVPVVANLLGSIERIALALECPQEQVLARMDHGLTHLVEPVLVEDAPFLRNVIAEPDLSKLPIPLHAELDGGPYITGAVTIGLDPDTGRHNLSYTRAEVKGPRRLTVLTNEWRHQREFFDKAEAKGQEYPLALTIGHDPVVLIAAGVKTPVDELQIAGGLRGRPIPVARCATIPVTVPANTDIVIEGIVRPGVREMEGPMAEFHHHYGAGWPVHVMEVTAICFRDEAIYHTIVPASFEHIYIGNVLPREPVLRRFVSHINPGARVHIPPYSSGFMALISVEKRNPGEPRNLALAALTSHMNLDVCIVVDPDVDIYNPHDVLWALATRVDWEHDVFVVPGAQGHEMCPAADDRGIIGKIGIDATLHKGRKREYAPRVQYHKVDLARYLQAKLTQVAG
jgi:2,5-furandicarboxylate decarboxylase 1